MESVEESLQEVAGERTLSHNIDVGWCLLQGEKLLFKSSKLGKWVTLQNEAGKYNLSGEGHAGIWLHGKENLLPVSNKPSF